MRSVRFTIAGLMGVVLILALGLAALRNPTGVWASFVPLVTRSLLCLAVVGAICRKGTERAWWLGFALFGWNHFGLPFGLYPYVPSLAMHRAFKALAPKIGVTFQQTVINPDPSVEWSFFLIGDCLSALLAAVVGGLLSRAIFSASSSAPEEVPAVPQSARQAPWNRWALSACILLSGVALLTSVTVAIARLSPGLWACATYLLTWWLIGLTALGAAIGRGRRREFWLGAAFFGAGFLLLVFGRNRDASHEPPTFLPTVQFFEAIRPQLGSVLSRIYGDTSSAAVRNTHILTILEQRVPMYIPDETTLDGFLTYVRDTTRSPDGKAIPIYVDPIELQRVQQSMRSKLERLDLEDVELRTTLRLLLKQIDLDYVVKDGLLLITSQASIASMSHSIEEDAYQTAGHCLLALVAAVLGGYATPLVCDLARWGVG
jgi:hypothetical protein